MSSWRCGKILPNPQIECEDGCTGTEGTITDEVARMIADGLSATIAREKAAARKRWRENSRPIDWSKVTNFAEWAELMELLYAHREMRVPFDHPQFEQFKKFLKP